ncbi:hypothetical protein B0H16DRAFT_108442 [Mycena metata]|uniref:TEA domain-containing protein n=1 Tax=Mycena metata TaxID=1033252 RepID=A0AAD7I8F1_9AGAR|nr:hypothetical protein B0H16DRAFT_108442 [Mycena metata]
MSWNQRYTSPSTSSSSYSSTPSSPSSERSPPLVSKITWPNVQSETTEDVLQSVIRVRKTWKTSRGGETVWPLELEAALLEGLEQYQPDDSRETRMLGRYPRRNRFISDYIFEKTGQRRSAKQVGSRLQQLRESCGGQRLLHLLSPFRKPAYSESTGSIDSALSSPILPGDGLFPSTSPRHIVMYIDLLPDEPRNNICDADGSSPWSDTGDVVRASNHPRRLESINPTVSFTSPTRILAHSRFTVYSESLILHAENVPLVPLVNDGTEAAGILYSTDLVPKYWRIILDSPDPTRFTIFQEVVKEENSAILFSATYKFSYPPANPCPSPQYDPHFGYTAARLDTSSSDVTPYHGHSSLPNTRYPVYGSVQENAPWTLPTLRSRENSPAENYSSPDSDPSVLCFPGEQLSNMYHS